MKKPERKILKLFEDKGYELSPYFINQGEEAWSFIKRTENDLVGTRYYREFLIKVENNTIQSFSLENGMLMLPADLGALQGEFDLYWEDVQYFTDILGFEPQETSNEKKTKKGIHAKRSGR